MRPRKTRQALKELSRLCDREGIDLDLDRGNGKGSHQTVWFTCKATGARLRLVIGGGAEISAGVQHSILAYLRTRAADAAVREPVRRLAARLVEILGRYFNA